MPTGSVHRAKTHCPQGHPYAGDNLRITAQGFRKCMTCTRENARKYRAQMGDAYRELERERSRTPARRDSYLRRKYGITYAEYEALLSAQGGVCAGCGAPPPGEDGRRGSRGHTVLVVDHCHATGKVRGLLCNLCNRLVGLVEDRADTLAALADYLR